MPQSIQPVARRFVGRAWQLAHPYWTRSNERLVAWALLAACRRCYASLFTDRAISYRQINGFDHFEVALSIGVQRMVRSDLACSGVMFSS